MPGYIIHLAIANKYLEKNKVADEDKFKEGVIAPDLTDDKSKTHYGEKSSKTDLKLYLSKNEIDNSYTRGYFLHLLTDFLFYNKYLEYYSTDLYNDYDILNGYLKEKYNVEVPKKVENTVFYKEGQLKILNKESIVKFINEVGAMDLEEVIKEIQSEEYKDKWKVKEK